MSKSSSTLQVIPVCFFLLLFPWFFIGGPEYESWRVFREAWNLGYILFFALFTFELDRYLQARYLSIRAKYFWTFLLVIGLASGIEVSQSFIFGREASLRGILLGFAGGFAVLVWKYTAQMAVSRRIVLRVLTGKAADSPYC